MSGRYHMCFLWGGYGKGLFQHLFLSLQLLYSIIFKQSTRGLCSWALSKIVRALCNMVIVELPHWAAGADLVLISGACVTACTQRAPRPGDRVGSCISSLLLLFSTEMLMIQHEPGAWLNVTRLPRFWPSHCEQTFLTYIAEEARSLQPHAQPRLRRVTAPPAGLIQRDTNNQVRAAASHWTILHGLNLLSTLFQEVFSWIKAITIIYIIILYFLLNF